MFHALLVAEFGAIQVCAFFGVLGDRPGWGCVKKLEDITSKPFKERPVLAQQNDEILNTTVKQSAFFRDARHQISHIAHRGKKDVGSETADETIKAVRGFMRMLAQKLPPVPS